MTAKPTERRDFLVSNTVRAAKASGQSVDAEAVARQAARDLAVVDRMCADGAVKTGSSKKAKTTEQKQAEARSRETAVADLAQQKQSRFYERAIDAKAPDSVALPKLRGVDAMRLAAMTARLQKICQPVPGYRLKPDEAVENQCAYPALARAAFMHTFCFARRLAGYRDLSYADRRRRYQRAIEDICDRSTAQLGPWWVK